MTATTREPTVEHCNTFTRPSRIWSVLTTSSAACPSAMLFEISSPVVPLYMAKPVEMESPDATTSPSVSRTTVRSVSVTVTGKSNSTVGVAPNSPPTVMASEAEPFVARQSVELADDSSGAGGASSAGALQAVSPATRPRATNRVAVLRTGNLTRKTGEASSLGYPALATDQGAPTHTTFTAWTALGVGRSLAASGRSVHMPYSTGPVKELS